MTQRFQYDAPKITRDEATELCVWHLRTAAALFQLVPDDDNRSLLAEIERQTEGDIDDVDRAPMKKWAEMILEAYNRMKDHD